MSSFSVYGACRDFELWEKGITIDLRLSHQAIAEAGSTRVTITRLLGDLRDSASLLNEKDYSIWPDSSCKKI